MAWNEPGNNNQPEDPWKKRGNDQGPPDLDEMLKKFQDRMGGMFGGGNGSGNTSGGPSLFPLVLVIAIIAGVFWAISGVYTVDAGKQGVVLRFGKYLETTTPGLRWHFPSPIESVEIVDTENIRNVSIGVSSAGGRRSAPDTLMLTKDENIVEASIAVQYQVKDARDFLFNVRDAELTLGLASASAMREVVASYTMDYLLREGREEVAVQTKNLVQKILDDYGTGLLVTTVNVQDIQPPEDVQPFFEDAIKAREDKERKINEAQAYANEVVPRAEGDAARVLAEANAYKAEVIERAQGDASRFNALLVEYKKAPEVTRDRLFIESIQQVLQSSSKVLLDDKQSNTMMYLPLDQLRSQGASSSTPRTSTGYRPQESSDSASPNTDRTGNPLRSRSREVR